MLTSLSHKLMVLGACALAGWVNLAVAQQQPGPRQPAFPPAVPATPAPAAGQPARPAVPSTLGNRLTDHVLEQCLIIENQGEVEIAKFAKEKAHSDDVKMFATMMIQDHSDFVSSLQEFHQKHAASGVRAAPGVGAAPSQQPTTQPTPQGGFNFLAIKQELGKECVASFKKHFAEIEGQQFDTCYMAHMVSAHMRMLDTLRVFKRHASPELAELIDGGIDTTEDHLMHAMNMVQQIDRPAAETVRRPLEERK